MTQRLDALSFLRAGRVAGGIGLAIFAAIAAGCTSTSLDDAAPTAATLPQTAPAPTGAQRGTATNTAGVQLVDAPVETVAAPAGPRGPKDTGTFPNLNIPPEVANQQITDAEKAAEVSALRAAQQQHEATLATAGKDTTNPVVLRKLAAEHADEALKKIEGN